MSIFKPSNHTPNMQEVDLDTSNTFSCLVNTSGETVKAYKLNVLSREGEPIYTGNATDLLAPVQNKGQLNIYNIDSNTHDTGKTFDNGKDYQWNVRLYNEKIHSTEQPNTKVCEGFLVGSTKSVVWSKIPKDETEVLDQILYDRYIEFVVPNGNSLVIGAHEPDDKELPTTYPYRQRKKIDWVTKEIGNNEDYVKIETTEPFDYDYIDNTEYQIYLCSDEHTVTSAYADPNTNINVANYIVMYANAAKAYADLANGAGPGEGAPQSLYSARKVVGYSSDTGEIRVHDAWPNAPTNGMVYRTFTQDVSTGVYSELFSSDIVFNVPANATYYDTTVKATSGSPITYYNDVALSNAAGTLQTNTSCNLFTMNGGSNGAVPVSTIFYGAATYYIPAHNGGTIPANANYVATNVDGRKGNIVANSVVYQVGFDELIPTVKGIECTGDDKYKMYEAQIIGGNPINNSSYFKSITNRWDANPNGVHRLFIQPNINIKPDLTNPDEIIFDNGVRVNIPEQYKINNDKKIDLTFNKLDNTQWLLEDNTENIAGTSIVTGEFAPVIPVNQSVPVVSQTDYIVYTSFADSMPNNIIYARTAPKITLQYRNALKELKEGYWVSNTEFRDLMGVVYEPSSLYWYYDVVTEIYYKWDTDILQYVSMPSRLIEGYYNGTDFLNEDNTKITPSTKYLYFNKVGNNYYNYTGSGYVEAIDKEVIWVNVESNIARPYREVKFKTLWEEAKVLTIKSGTTLYYSDTLSGNSITTNIDVDSTNPSVEIVLHEGYATLVVLEAIGNIEANTTYYTAMTNIWTSEGATMIDPQIKNYQYSLYAYAPNSTVPDLIKQSEVYYSTDTYWTFRGLDGTTSSYYTILNPHVYKIAVKIIDEYDREYNVAQDFSIFYETENAPISIKVDFLCDDQANQVNVSSPAYAETTPLNEGTPQEIPSVDEEDIDGGNGRIVIPDGETLNYTQVSSSGNPLSFPKSFTMYTKLDLTENFVQKYKAENEANLVEVAHDLGTITSVIPSGTQLYITEAPINTPYFKDPNFSIQLGELDTARPYSIYNSVSNAGYLYPSESTTTICYINLDSVKYRTTTADIMNKNAGIQLIQEAISSTLIVTNGGASTANIEDGTYYLLTNNIDSSTDTEIFTYKVNVEGPYKLIESNGHTQIQRNQDCYNIKLYSHLKDEIQEDQELGCFYVNIPGNGQDSINLMDVNEDAGLQIIPLYALQTTFASDPYVVIGASDPIPSLNQANPTKKYVFATDRTIGTVTYSSGIYQVLEATGGTRYWSQVLDEDYVYIENTADIVSDVELTYGDLQVPVQARMNGSGDDQTGDIGWFDDGGREIANTDYVWIDNGSNQSAFIAYITNYYILIFLKVEYDKEGNRQIISQVKLERKV